MRLLGLFYPKKLERNADSSNFLFPVIVGTVLWFSFFDKLRFVFLGSNMAIRFVQFLILFLLYVFALCGVEMLLGSTFKRVFLIPASFLPYILLPIYYRIFMILNLPWALAFAVPFVHSSIISMNYVSKLLILLRAAGYVLALLVVKSWF